MNESDTPLWSNQGYLAIPVTGHIKKNGACAVGSKAGLEARRRIPGFEYAVGGLFERHGGHVVPVTDTCFAYLYKPSWDGPPDFDLLASSLSSLSQQVYPHVVYAARPGTGRGEMKWEDVRERLLEFDIPNNITFVPNE